MRAALAALLLLALPAHAQMYKCVDERGVTHYSDKPRADCKGGAVDIRPQPPISGGLAPKTEDLGRQELEFRRRQVQRGQQQDAEARKLAQQQRRCAGLRASLANYSSGRRVARVDAKGERSFLSDAEREARIAQLNAEIAGNCP